MTNTTVQRDFGFLYTFGGRCIKYNIIYTYYDTPAVTAHSYIMREYKIYTNTVYSVRVLFFEFIPSHRCFLYECTYSARVCTLTHTAIKVDAVHYPMQIWRSRNIELTRGSK